MRYYLSRIAGKVTTLLGCLMPDRSSVQAQVQSIFFVESLLGVRLRKTLILGCVSWNSLRKEGYLPTADSDQVFITLTTDRHRPRDGGERTPDERRHQGEDQRPQLQVSLVWLQQPSVRAPELT